ncbi:MAG: hypothetical protein WAV23_00810 [Minisyncoccia bacterium]
MKTKKILSVLSTVIVPWEENSKKGSRYDYMSSDSIKISLLEDGSIFFEERRNVGSIAYVGSSHTCHIHDYCHHYDKETFYGYFSRKFGNEIYQKLIEDAKKLYGVEKIENLMKEIEFNEKKFKSEQLQKELTEPIEVNSFLKDYVEILKKNGFKTVGDCLNCTEKHLKSLKFPKRAIEIIRMIKKFPLLKDLGFKPKEE